MKNLKINLQLYGYFIFSKDVKVTQWRNNIVFQQQEPLGYLYEQNYIDTFHSREKINFI